MRVNRNEKKRVQLTIARRVLSDAPHDAIKAKQGNPPKRNAGRIQTVDHPLHFVTERL